MNSEDSLLCLQEPTTGPPNNPSPRPCVAFCNKPLFYGEKLLATSLTPKPEDHPLSAVRNSLFLSLCGVQGVPENLTVFGNEIMF
jgi:hypothetical protein